MFAISFADILLLNVYGVGHVNVKTTGTRPPATTALSMLCKEKFNMAAVHDHLLQEDGDVNMAALWSRAWCASVSRVDCAFSVDA